MLMWLMNLGFAGGAAIEGRLTAEVMVLHALAGEVKINEILSDD